MNWKRNKLLLVIALIFAVVFNSCKKYPDDPFLSFRKPENRLCSGEWTLSLYTIDGKDSTAAALSWMSQNKLIFKKEDESGLNLYSTNLQPNATNGVWFFSNKKSEITIRLSYPSNLYYYVGIFGKGGIKWHINELTIKKMNLTVTIDNIEHVLIFNK